MDNQRNHLHSFAYFCPGKSMEELKHSLLCTTLDLEQTKAAVQAELKKRDDQLHNMRELLNKAIRERDEAQDKYQRLILEKLFLQQQQQQNAPLSGISSIEDDPRRGIDSSNGLSSSDCEESIVSSPVMEHLTQPQMQMQMQTQPPPPQPPLVPSSVSDSMIELTPDRPLPEKGKLLQAVMKAGPLLQTLLLAGPLPQWRHPPPPLESFEIPPVTIPSVVAPQPQPPQLLHQDSFINGSCNNTATNNCGRVSRKRAFCESTDSPSETKFQRIVLH
ncbi:uncharacterized protein LOC130969349 [Arachis stenosperma]|uniref:uncharacterized protein LOC130969349 n=1 Tax=Arachis stenosperma TaxID=217475 RepID=UPI0025ACFE35|nr:uncharacterized protein LOC130969349 [Arachis stenosperma]